jgi:O-antigen/teichoic acid export membrane protein
VILLYLPGKDATIRTACYLSLLIGPLTLINRYGIAIIQGERRFALFNVLRLIVPVLYAAGVALVFLLGQTELLSFILSWVLAHSVSCVFVGAAVYASATPSLDDAGLPPAATLLRFGAKGLVGTMSPVESFRFDQLIAGLALSPAALGIYAVARAFTNLPVFISASVSMVVYPSVAGRDSDAGLKLVRRAAWAMVLFNIAFVGVLIAIMPVIIPWFFGAEFQSSVLVAQVLLAGTGIYAVRRVATEGFRGLGFPLSATYSEAAMLISLAVIIPFVLVSYGIVGLAIGIAMGHVVGLLVAAALAWKKHR